MIKITNIQAAKAIGALLILLSGNAFAGKPKPTAPPAPVYATKLQLDAEVTRATGAESVLGTAIATETARAKAAEVASARAPGTHVIDANGMDLGMLLGGGVILTTYIESIGKSINLFMNPQNNKLEVMTFQLLIVFYFLPDL